MDLFIRHAHIFIFKRQNIDLFKYSPKKTNGKQTNNGKIMYVFVNATSREFM